MANQLVLSPNLQNIVDDVNQKNTEEITGADIAEMIEAIESKSTYVNKGFVEDQISILNEEYLKYLKNIEDLSKRFAEKRLEILESDQPRRPIRIVGMN